MRFGFVRYKAVTEPERLALKLDNIFIEHLKLFVNSPRYERTATVSKQEHTKREMVKPIRQQWRPKSDLGKVRREGIIKEMAIPSLVDRGQVDLILLRVQSMLQA